MDDYFGKALQKTVCQINGNGRIYGRITEYMEKLHVFSNRWDFDQQINHGQEFGMVRLEDINTPLQSTNQQQQQPSSVDQQQEQEQSSSKTAAETHSILMENQSEPTIHYFLTVNGNDGAEVFDEGHCVLDSTRYSGAQYPFTENAPEVSDR